MHLENSDSNRSLLTTTCQCSPDIQLHSRMTQEKFCLRWNDFESNISSAFRELRSESDLLDVTIACEDENILAHRVILSACSSFFKTILKRSRSHQNLVLYLRGVARRDMENVLDFMYHGEVSVAQADLNSFLQVAEELQVKGERLGVRSEAEG